MTKMLSSQDAQYADLERRAKAGDKRAEAEAQRMVDAAAKAAGYTVGPVWHGTRAQFTSFRVVGNSRGYWFADTQDEAIKQLRFWAPSRGGRSRILRVFLRLGNSFETSEGLGYVEDENQTIEGAVANGYDSVTWDDGRGRNIYVVFGSSQIKSADPFTYRDDGTLIPLSQRFDSSKEDIRESVFDGSTPEDSVQEAVVLESVEAGAILAHVRKTNPHTGSRDALQGMADPSEYVWEGPLWIQPDDPRLDRAGLHPASSKDVRKYATAYKGGSPFPPVVLTLRGGKLVVQDGAHRLQAALDLHQPIQAYVGTPVVRESVSVRPTPEMESWFDERTRKHIALVQMYARKIIKAFPSFEELLDAVQEHDAMKFEEPERIPYVFLTWQWKDPDYQYTDAIKDMGHRATLHHVRNNEHHPEHWATSFSGDSVNPDDRDAPPEELVDASLMPELALAEMCADWCAMGEEKGNSPLEWARKNIGVRWSFTPDQEELIYGILATVWEGAVVEMKGRESSVGQEAEELVDLHGFRTVADAYEWLTDDRSHGDDWLAGAAHEEVIEQFGTDDPTVLQRISADDMVGFVQSVLARAREERRLGESRLVEDDAGAELVVLVKKDLFVREGDQYHWYDAVFSLGDPEKAKLFRKWLESTAGARALGGGLGFVSWTHAGTGKFKGHWGTPSGGSPTPEEMLILLQHAYEQFQQLPPPPEKRKRRSPEEVAADAKALPPLDPLVLKTLQEDVEPYLQQWWDSVVDMYSSEWDLYQTWADSQSPEVYPGKPSVSVYFEKVVFQRKLDIRGKDARSVQMHILGPWVWSSYKTVEEVLPKFRAIATEFTDFARLHLLQAVGHYLPPTGVSVKSVSHTTLHHTGGTLTGVWMVVYEDGTRKQLHTQMIWAGGYNIQRLHTRYLVHVRDLTPVSESLLGEATDTLQMLIAKNLAFVNLGEMGMFHVYYGFKIGSADMASGVYSLEEFEAAVKENGYPNRDKFLSDARIHELEAQFAEATNRLHQVGLPTQHCEVYISGPVLAAQRDAGGSAYVGMKPHRDASHGVWIRAGNATADTIIHEWAHWYYRRLSKEQRGLWDVWFSGRVERRTQSKWQEYLESPRFAKDIGKAFKFFWCGNIPESDADAVLSSIQKFTVPETLAFWAGKALIDGEDYEEGYLQTAWHGLPEDTGVQYVLLGSVAAVFFVMPKKPYNILGPIAEVSVDTIKYLIRTAYGVQPDRLNDTYTLDRYKWYTGNPGGLVKDIQSLLQVIDGRVLSYSTFRWPSGTDLKPVRVVFSETAQGAEFTMGLTELVEGSRPLTVNAIATLFADGVRQRMIDESPEPVDTKPSGSRRKRADVAQDLGLPTGYGTLDPWEAFAELVMSVAMGRADYKQKQILSRFLRNEELPEGRLCAMQEDRPDLRKGLRFYHKRVLDPILRQSQLYEITKIARGVVYYAPIYRDGNTLYRGKTSDYSPVAEFWARVFGGLVERCRL